MHGRIAPLVLCVPGAVDRTHRFESSVLTHWREGKTSKEEGFCVG